MRKSIWVVALLALVTLAVAAPALAKHGKGNGNKVTICHKTGSGYVKITVARASLKAHRAHGDIVPAPAGGCPTSQQQQPQAHHNFTSTLSAVAPNTVGTGTVKVFTSLLGGGKGRVCLQANLTGITGQTVQLWRTATHQLLVSISRPAATNLVQGCVVVSANLVRNIRQHTANFSVTVGNATFATALSGTLTAAP